MASLPSISPSIRRSLLAVEISILVVSLWFNLSNPELQESSNILNIILSTVAIAPFIAILPVSRPLWQRRVYVLLAIITLCVFNHFRIPIYSLNLVFLLKGCFLLPRSEVIIIAAIGLILDVSSFSIRAPELFEIARHRNIEAYLNVPKIITNIVMAYFANCTFAEGVTSTPVRLSQAGFYTVR
jgi:hypothetical protein